MIVKDEASVIARCLASVRTVIGSWVIVDTGSTDGTQDVVRSALADLPGQLVERPWRDFGHNRSEALALARSQAAYTLIIDADDELLVPPGPASLDPTADAYSITISDKGFAYRRLQIVRNVLPWRYAGVLHEFLTCDDAFTVGHLPWTMRRNHDGQRRRDPDAYRKDAAILQQALATERDPYLSARYGFYLAQSWRDCGEPEKALDAYLARSEMGFWEEEVFYSLYQAGKLMESLGRDLEAVLAMYARATQAQPKRAEAAHAGARLCRLAGQFARAFALAKPARDLTSYAEALFYEGWIYEYGLKDELSVAAYHVGAHRECLDAALRALASARVPPADVLRLVTNMRCALERL